MYVRACVGWWKNGKRKFGASRKIVLQLELDRSEKIFDTTFGTNRIGFQAIDWKSDIDDTNITETNMTMSHRDICLPCLFTIANGGGEAYWSPRCYLLPSKISPHSRILFIFERPRATETETETIEKEENKRKEERLKHPKRQRRDKAFVCESGVWRHATLGCLPCSLSPTKQTKTHRERDQGKKEREINPEPRFRSWRRTSVLKS